MFTALRSVKTSDPAAVCLGGIELMKAYPEVEGPARSWALTVLANSISQ